MPKTSGKCWLCSHVVSREPFPVLSTRWALPGTILDGLWFPQGQLETDAPSRLSKCSTSCPWLSLVSHRQNHQDIFRPEPLQFKRILGSRCWGRPLPKTLESCWHSDERQLARFFHCTVLYKAALSLSELQDRVSPDILENLLQQGSSRGWRNSGPGSECWCPLLALGPLLYCRY